MQNEAAREADRYARRGEWNEADIHCAHAIADQERRREREPDDLAHVIELAELHYFHAEILGHVGRVLEAVGAARISRDLYRAVVGIDPVRVADRVRDAQSRLSVLELMVRDAMVPAANRVAAARALAADDPSAGRDLDVARQIARQVLESPSSSANEPPVPGHVAAWSEPAPDGLPLVLEAVSIYRRLRPLGEDDLDLFGRVALRAAEALLDAHAYYEAVDCATDAVQAFGALAVRRPERYDRPSYEARELAARGRELAEAAGPGIPHA